ncbi:hypothetical protein [Listeria valentina]|uniref:hypothetical protein n=1 Tax=Listeria valentina TaxID=2705293 RepID=UPI00143128D0|nr:hypothetical protein [Listeria valentina]
MKGEVSSIIQLIIKNPAPFVYALNGSTLHDFEHFAEAISVLLEEDRQAILNAQIASSLETIIRLKKLEEEE